MIVYKTLNNVDHSRLFYFQFLTTFAFHEVFVCLVPEGLVLIANSIQQCC